MLWNYNIDRLLSLETMSERGKTNGVPIFLYEKLEFILKYAKGNLGCLVSLWKDTIVSLYPPVNPSSQIYPSNPPTS